MIYKCAKNPLSLPGLITAWQLSVSVDKCGVLDIGKYVAPTTFAINNFPLPVVTSYRDLGSGSLLQ